MLVSVGYMDPGNWSTDLSAGAGFKYDLLFIVALVTAPSVTGSTRTLNVPAPTGLSGSG